MAGITRYLKIAEEKGFAEEAEGKYEVLDPESAELDPEEEDKLVYEGMSGLDRVVQLGAYSTTGSISLPFDSVIAPMFFKLALGGYEQEGDTHTFYPATSPEMHSFTAKVGKDIMEHVFLGTVVSGIDVEVENEWVNMSVDLVGCKDKKGVLAERPQFSEGEVFAAHQVTLSRDDTDITPMVDSMSLTIETGADVEAAQGPGSRFPKRAYRGALVVNLEITIGFTDEGELLRYWDNDDGPSENSMAESSYTIHIGEDIDITIPRLIYMSATQPAEGREHIVQTLACRGLVENDEDHNGPILMSVNNDVESYDVDDRHEETDDSETDDSTSSE